MRQSVQQVCEALVRSRLLSADEVAALQERWRREVNDPADLGRFSKWLVANEVVTPYQAALLAQGRDDAFFLGPYCLLDRIGKGGLAVVYKAMSQRGQGVARDRPVARTALDPPPVDRW